MGRPRRTLVAVLVVLVIVAAGVAAHRPLLKLVAEALIVEDPLQRADAIVVVAGATPSREAAAATLFREGWASRVVISNQATPDRTRELIRLGVRPLDFQGEARQALIKYGVPPGAILALPEPVKITETELRAVHAAARAHGYRRLILVTSPHHTRRVRLIWSREGRSDIEGLVVGARIEAFPVDGWWGQRRIAEEVLHEYLGLLALYLHISGLMR